MAPVHHSCDRIRARKVTSENVIFGGSHFSHLTWAFCGGERTRTADFYDAKVWLSVF